MGQAKPVSNSRKENMGKKLIYVLVVVCAVFIIVAPLQF